MTDQIVGVGGDVSLEHDYRFLMAPHLVVCGSSRISVGVLMSGIETHRLLRGVKRSFGLDRIGQCVR